MKIITPGTTILFLEGSNIGPENGEGGSGAKVAPQIAEFEIYYDSPLVVGFHVLSEEGS